MNEPAGGAPLFLFYGVEGESVLAPLCAAMRERGHRCVEIVAGGEGDAAARIAALAAQRPARVVLVTCAHFVHDAVAMEQYLGIAGALAPQEVRARLRPELTVYVPHDLSGPLRWDEIAQLGMVDLYLGASDAERMFRRRTDVEIVGWARYLGEGSAAPRRRGRALWLYSDAESSLRRDGPAAVHGRMLPFMRKWCAIKFAPYAANRALEDLLRADGHAVVDSAERPADLAPCFDLIATNGESSVVRETGLIGKPVFILTDPALFPQRQLSRLWQFADMPNVHCVPDLDAIPGHVVGAEPRLKAFDMDAAIAAILRRVPAPR